MRNIMCQPLLLVRRRGLGEHPRCCQAKCLKVEEKLVHLKMVVKFKVLIKKKKICSLGLMMFDWWMEFLMVHLEELEMKKLLLEKEEAWVESMVERFEEDEDEKKSRKMAHLIRKYRIKVQKLED
nr:hypothetical protein [Tanacetum cinerariifolium]